MQWVIWFLMACGESGKSGDSQNIDVVEDLDGDGYFSDEDCDDGESQTNPGAEEICDGLDNNCDGQADEGVKTIFYADTDGDGFGNPEIVTEACSVPEGYVSNGSDCDDTEEDAFPGGEELCDGLDNDCNGEVDEGLDVSFFIDADGDGFGDDNNVVSGCNPDLGLTPIGGDCDDGDPALSPIANEICDEIDNNCDGNVDEGVTTTFYFDFDEDGYGDVETTMEACSLPEGHVENDEDCDDVDSEVNPQAAEQCDEIDNDCDGDIDEEGALGATLWYEDGDEDGYGSATATMLACEQPAGYVLDNTDCEDNISLFHPGAAETCNGFDDNCDGQIDEATASDASIWYNDADLDGFGDDNSTTTGCTQPTGYVADNTDCDDQDSDVYPGAVEICNGDDDNCDGTIDGSDAADVIVSYLDADEDGFGDGNASSEDCEIPSGYVLYEGDCDDDNAAINPASLELCDSADNNCDGNIDEDSAIDASEWYEDADGDGYGTASIPVIACDAPNLHADNTEDCNDLDASISPAGTESCDEIDNDCDGDIDEDATDAATWYIDHDGDGYGSSDYTMVSCEQPTGYLASDDDCDDTEATVNPNASEICDALDNDCNGSVDEGLSKSWYLDIDGDGYGLDSTATTACEAPTSDYVVQGGDCADDDVFAFPGATETCEGIDSNCDGDIDNDADGDGYSDEACGGSDCDDSDPSSYLDTGSCLTGVSCADILSQYPSASDGAYTIDVDGANSGADPFEVYCDMTTDEGGWTLVASVATQSSFWTASTYTATNSARVQTLGSPDIDQNYVLHLSRWQDLLAAGGSSSMLRLTVRRIDNDNDVTLGFLEGIQMNADATFQNAVAAYDGNMNAKSATGACVIQYNSNFENTIVFAAFDNSDSACTGALGWNGFCGYTSLGHDGSYAGSGSYFSHACSLDNNYYCGSDYMSGSGSNFCYFKRKWFWIR